MAVRFDQSDSVTGADHRNANQTTTTTMEFQRKTNRLSHWTPAVNRNGIPAGIKLKVFFLKIPAGIVTPLDHRPVVSFLVNLSATDGDFSAGVCAIFHRQIPAG